MTVDDHRRRGAVRLEALATQQPLDPQWGHRDDAFGTVRCRHWPAGTLLALLGYFQPVPDEVFAGYAEVRPIEAGFAERRDLWRVAAWLAVVAASAGYLGQLNAAVRRYV